MGRDVNLHALLGEQIYENAALHDSVGQDRGWGDEQTEDPWTIGEMGRIGVGMTIEL